MKTLSIATASLLLTGAAAAQNFHLNEIYYSHTSTDDMEMIEIIGDANASLDGIMVIVVEGEGSGTGTADDVWDLSGLSTDANGFFVLGNTAVTCAGLDIGASNAIENGTNSYYLISTTDTAAIQALEGTDLDPEDDGTTVLATDVTVTILDLIATTDSGLINSGDTVFDCAQIVGPDGSFAPPGIYRCGDYPGLWGVANFLDFDDVVNMDEPRTPCAPNGGCSSDRIGTNYCVPIANTTGEISITTATGSYAVADNDVTLATADLPLNQFAIYIFAANKDFMPVAAGNLCVGSPFIRLAGNVLFTGATGEVSLALDLNALPQMTVINPGDTYYFQLWHRDGQQPLGSPNFSQGLAILFE